MTPKTSWKTRGDLGRTVRHVYLNNSTLLLSLTAYHTDNSATHQDLRGCARRVRHHLSLGLTLVGHDLSQRHLDLRYLAGDLTGNVKGLGQNAMNDVLSCSLGVQRVLTELLEDSGRKLKLQNVFLWILRGTWNINVLSFQSKKNSKTTSNSQQTKTSCFYLID